MNRAFYFDEIERKLSFLGYRLELRSKMNVLNLNIHVEDFYLNFFNVLFLYELSNLNATVQNAAAIDLIDHKNKIVIQVSSTATKAKIEGALSKEILSSYKEYSFKFISISKDAGSLRSGDYKNPHGLSFDPSADIFDIKRLLDLIQPLEISHLKKVYEFVLAELQPELQTSIQETHLASIIGILANIEWEVGESYESIPFAIEDKLNINNLKAANILVEQQAVNHTKLSVIYDEYILSGINKSSAVLASIRRSYSSQMSSLSGDDLFFSIIFEVIDRIKKSANYVAIPEDELENCVEILVVDAFIRCKIFLNPEGYKHVDS